jgi:hypothetical protein
LAVDDVASCGAKRVGQTIIWSLSNYSQLRNVLFALESNYKDSENFQKLYKRVRDKINISKKNSTIEVSVTEAEAVS